MVDENSGSDITTSNVNIKFGFFYDGDGPGRGGEGTIYVDGESVARGRVEKTQPNIFSGDETADVGLDNQTPVAVTEDIGYGPEETRFTGKIDKVIVAVK